MIELGVLALASSAGIGWRCRFSERPEGRTPSQEADGEAGHDRCVALDRAEWIGLKGGPTIHLNGIIHGITRASR